MSAFPLEHNKAVITATSVDGNHVEIFRRHASDTCKNMSGQNLSSNIVIRTIILKDIFGAKDGANSLAYVSKYDRGVAFAGWIRLTDTVDDLTDRFARAGRAAECPAPKSTMGGAIRRFLAKFDTGVK